MLNVQGDCKVVKRRVCNGEVHKVRDDGTKITCDQVQWINICSICNKYIILATIRASSKQSVAGRASRRGRTLRTRGTVSGTGSGTAPGTS